MAPWRSGWLLCAAACLPGATCDLVQQTTALRAREEVPQIQISGRHILVDGKILHLKGVCYSPVPVGESPITQGLPAGRVDNPAALKWAENAEKDSTLMQQAGINAIRVYFPIMDTNILDIFWGKGIYVIQPAWNGLGETIDLPSRIAAVKSHPSILFWEVGNEWNYNRYYQENDLCKEFGNDYCWERSVNVTKESAAQVKALDPAHPTVCVYGNVPSKDLVDDLVDIDIWALNVYRSIDFGTLFQEWADISGKPMYLGEYGADAWNGLTEAYDPENQALATVNLTAQISANSVVGNPSGGICSGALIFEFSDEWWKDMSENSSIFEHDVGGIAPGGGPWPDKIFNEEYWGLLDVDRNPRPAFTAYKDALIPQPPTPAPSPPAPSPPESSAVRAVAAWVVGGVLVALPSVLFF